MNKKRKEKVKKDLVKVNKVLCKIISLKNFYELKEKEKLID